MIQTANKKSKKDTPNKRDKNIARIYKPKEVLSEEVAEPLNVSVSEAAKLGGVTTKTIRRAIQNKTLAYAVINDRYIINFRSVIKFLYTKRKLKNKLNQSGIGQYIREWKD